MREGASERERVQAGQEGARDISTGRVKKLRGWRSDQTGLRRSRAKPWGKFTGTRIFQMVLIPPMTFPPFFFAFVGNSFVARDTTVHHAVAVSPSSVLRPETAEDKNFGRY